MSNSQELKKPRVGILVQLSEDIEKTLSVLCKLGFSSGQLACEDMRLYNPQFLRTVKETLQKYNFHVSAFYCGWSGYYTYAYPDMYATLGLIPDYLRHQRIQDIIRGIEFAHDLGVRTVLSHIGYLPDNPLDPVYQQVQYGLRSLLPILKTNNQTFAFETGEMLPLTLKMLILSLDREIFGMNLDPANLLTSGRANPRDALRMLAPFIKGVHAKDGNYPQGDAPKGEEKPLGKGQADFEGIIRDLKQYNYQGEITIENEMYTPEREQQLVESKRYLESLIDKVYAE